MIYAIDLRVFSLLYAYGPKVAFSLVSHISFPLLLYFHILCLFGLESLLCLWVLLIYFLLDSLYWEGSHSFECSSWVTEFFNSIFILTWVFSGVSIPFLNSDLGSLVASAISSACLCFLGHHLGIEPLKFFLLKFTELFLCGFLKFLELFDEVYDSSLNFES